MSDYLPDMTRGDRRRRRRAIATFVQLQGTADAAAEKFGVSLDLVRRCCKEYGVDCRRESNKTRGGSTVYAVLAELLNTRKSLTEIARERSVTRQRASEIYGLARKAGIDVPERTGGAPSGAATRKS